MSEPRKREWVVPEYTRTDDDGYPLAVDREEALQAFVEAETLLYRIGGVLMVAPVRMDLGDRWLTTGYQFRHESYAPAIKNRGLVQDGQEPEELTPEPEPELAKAG